MCFSQHRIDGLQRRTEQQPQSSRHSRSLQSPTAQVFPGRSAADMPFHSTLLLPALEVFSAGVQPRRAVYILRSIAVRNVVSKAEIPAAGATIEE